MVTQDRNSYYPHKKIYRTKGCIGKYKKKLSRINKRLDRFNTDQYIKLVLDEDSESNTDLVMSEFMTDAWYQDYHMFEHDDWLEYLGRNWSLEDELDYCDKVYENYEVEEEYNFTDEEIDYAVNSWKKGNDKTELDPIQRAMNAYQAVKAWQDAWMKYGTVGAVKLYFSLDK